MAPPRRKTLRILCFGDSLTQGWFHYGIGEHPYSTRVSQRLREILPEGTELEMRTSGVAGDVAAFLRFRERFTRESMFHDTERIFQFFNFSILFNSVFF